MKKMNRKYVAGTAFALGAAAALTGCCLIPQPAPGVYGPAPSHEVESFREETDTEPVSTEPVTEEVTFQEESFSVEEEIEVDVYGPPEFFAGD